MTPDVLVVDDEPDVRSSVAEILRGAGYEVEEAADGFEAMEVLHSQQVGAVLLDLRMPRCDGPTLVKQLRDPPPIVIVSAQHVGPAERAQMGSKVVAVLKKPVPPQQLLERVANVLKGDGR